MATPTPLSYPLNRRNVEKFIDACDESVQEYCDIIINNTLYVSYEDFFRQLNITIDEYLERFHQLHIVNNKPIYIYNFLADKTRNYQFKSNYWINTYVIMYLRKKVSCDIKTVTYLDIVNLELAYNSTILFIDDCIYSGYQLGTTILKLNRNKLYYNFYILVPYASKKGIESIIYEYDRRIRGEISPIEPSFRDNPRASLRIKKQKTGGQSFVKNKPIGEYIIESANTHSRQHITCLYFPSKAIEVHSVVDYLEARELEILKYFYNNENFITLDSFMVYFDHKLAGRVSTPNLIYLGIVPNEKNRKLMEGKTDFSNVSNELQIIPIITNCEHLTNVSDINLKEPKCPRPPYKENHKEWIRELISRGKIGQSLPTNLNSKSIDKVKKIKQYNVSI